MKLKIKNYLKTLKKKKKGKLEVLLKKNSTALVLNFSLASKHYLMKPCQSNINQSTQKRGGIQGTRMEGPHPRRPKNHLRGRKTRGISKFPNPLGS